MPHNSSINSKITTGQLSAWNISCSPESYNKEMELLSSILTSYENAKQHQVDTSNIEREIFNLVNKLLAYKELYTLLYTNLSDSAKTQFAAYYSKASTFANNSASLFFPPDGLTSEIVQQSIEYAKLLKQEYLAANSMLQSGTIRPSMTLNNPETEIAKPLNIEVLKGYLDEWVNELAGLSGQKANIEKTTRLRKTKEIIAFFNGHTENEIQDIEKFTLRYQDIANQSFQKVWELLISHKKIQTLEIVGEKQNQANSRQHNQAQANQPSIYTSKAIIQLLSNIQQKGTSLKGLILNKIQINDEIIKLIVNNFTNLLMLEFTDCELTEFPLELGKLPNLEVLKVRKNQIKVLPEFKDGLFANLQNLNLTYNPLSTIEPNSLSALKNLKTLDLSETLKPLDEEKRFELLKHLFNEKPSSLEELNLVANGITKLPEEELAKLCLLQRLTLSRNEISTFPIGIKNFNQLKVLNLSHNQINIIPSLAENEKYNFENLKTFDISHNPLVSIDKDFLKHAQVLVKAYFNNTQLNGVLDLTITSSELTDLEFNNIATLTSISENFMVMLATHQEKANFSLKVNNTNIDAATKARLAKFFERKPAINYYYNQATGKSETLDQEIYKSNLPN